MSQDNTTLSQDWVWSPEWPTTEPVRCGYHDCGRLADPDKDLEGSYCVKHTRAVKKALSLYAESA